MLCANKQSAAWPGAERRAWERRSLSRRAGAGGRDVPPAAAEPSRDKGFKGGRSHPPAGGRSRLAREPGQLVRGALGAGGLGGNPVRTPGQPCPLQFPPCRGQPLAGTRPAPGSSTRSVSWRGEEKGDPLPGLRSGGCRMLGAVCPVSLLPALLGPNQYPSRSCPASRSPARPRAGPGETCQVSDFLQPKSLLKTCRS